MTERATEIDGSTLANSGPDAAASLPPITNTDTSLKAPKTPALPINEALEATNGWSTLVERLEEQIDSVFKYSVRVTSGKGDKRIELPTSVDAYSDTVYTAGEPPSIVSDGHTIHKEVSIWYAVKEHHRHVAKVDYVVTDATGKVIEVGARSQDTLDIFKENIFGRDVSEQDLLRLYNLNESLIAALRASDTCAKKLEDFREGRGHKKEWSDRASLAYFDPENFDVLEWGKQHNFSESDLFKAGFVERSVTETGVRYSNRAKPVVFIPFKDEEGRIVLWRMRVIKPKNPGDPKYLSAPLERADRYPPSVHRELYQSELLKEIKEKPLIITEGEFKCLVTTQLTGFAAVGITGITQVTDLIIQRIVEADPSRVIIILDRDPKGKGFARTDELTDSERAAFMIAERLQRAGHGRVTIGTIPDHFDGDKCGIDDLLLDIDRKDGQAAATGALQKVLDESLSPRAWLAKRSNDPALQQLLARVQRLRQVHRDFSSHLARSNKYADDPMGRLVAEKRLADVTAMLQMLQATYSRHLEENYNGARRINQPPRKFLTLYPVHAVRDSNRKCLVTAHGEVLQLDHCKDPILSLRATPPDLAKSEKLAKAEGIPFPISMAKLSNAYHYPRKESDIAALYLHGFEILSPQEEHTMWRAKKVSYEAFIQRVFAGWLATIYPPSEYHYEEGVSLRKVHRTHWEEVARVPITIFKDGTKPIAFCFLPYWNTKTANENLQVVDGAGVASHEARQMAVANLAREAALTESRMRAAIRSFLRSPALETQVNKLTEISEVLKSVCSDEGRARAVQSLQTVGVSREVTLHTEAISLAKQNHPDFVSALGQADLINQGIQSGLLTVTRGEGFAQARFAGDVVLFPERNEGGLCIGFTVFPVDGTDRSFRNFPPVPKRCYTVDSIRSTTRTFDRTRTFFPAIEREQLQGKTVLIVPSELECLQLRSVVLAANRPDVVVLGIREFDTIARAQYQRLATSGCSRVIFLGQKAQSHELAIRYAPLAVCDAKTHAAMCSDALKGVAGAPPISAVTTSEELASLLVEIRKDETVSSDFVEQLLQLPTFTPDERTLATLHLSELLAEIETAVAMRGMNHSGDPKEPLFDYEDAIKMLRMWWSKADMGLRSLEEFLGDRYLVSPESALNALMQGFDRPVYVPGSPVANKLPYQMWHDFVGVHNTVKRLRERAQQPKREGPFLSADRLWLLETSPRDPSKLTAPELQSILQRLADREVCTIATPLHQHVEVLGRRCHYVTLSLKYRGEVMTACGGGLTKKGAEADARHQMYAEIQKHSDFREVFGAELIAHEKQQNFEKQFQDRRCLASLKRDVKALRRAGINTDLIEGKHRKTEDGRGWIVPLTLIVDGAEHSSQISGSSPDASREMAAAPLIVQLRDILKQMRARGEYKDPTNVVDELKYLAALLGAQLEETPVTESLGKEMESSTTAHSRLWSWISTQLRRILPRWHMIGAVDNAPPKTAATSFRCSWTLRVGEEEITKTALAPKKVQAQRAVASELLRELEERDSVQGLVQQL